MKQISMRCNLSHNGGLQRSVLVLGLSMLGMGLGGRMASSQSSVSSISLVGVTDNGGFLTSLDRQDVSGNATASASATKSFTGLDRAGNTQTMTFSGNTVSRSDYGRLHCYTSASLTNSYYNAANPAYTDGNGNVVNPAGSPTSLAALGFAFFDDTLQYGGSLQAGYKAHYIFHVDGTNSGTGTLADLGVTIGSNPSDTFFASDPGPFAADWVTQDYAINGITPQSLHVQFSDQVVFDNINLTDGQNYTGTSDFGSTLTLTGIEVVDAGGVPVSGWTVTSGSGTRYPLALAANTPEPGVVALLTGLGVPASLLALRRRRFRTRR